MKGRWRAILGRHGRQVVVEKMGQEVQVRAFIQPVLDKKLQFVPSPLGLRPEERAVYLGPGDVQLHPGESVVRDAERVYEVRAARSVGNGHHVWALLQRKEREE